MGQIIPRLLISIVLSIILLVGSSLAIQDAYAISKTFTGADVTDANDWDKADNWNPVGVPANGDVATIPTGQSVTLSSVKAFGPGGGLIVETGATLTIITPGSLQFDVGSTFSNSGTIIVDTSSILNVNGVKVLNCGNFVGNSCLCPQKAATFDGNSTRICVNDIIKEFKLR